MTGADQGPRAQVALSPSGISERPGPRDRGLSRRGRVFDARRLGLCGGFWGGCARRMIASQVAGGPRLPFKELSAGEPFSAFGKEGGAPGMDGHRDVRSAAGRPGPRSGKRSAVACQSGAGVLLL